jgi:hypothetical protein
VTDREFISSTEAALIARANRANRLTTSPTSRKASSFVSELRRLRDLIDFERSDTSIPRPYGYGFVKLAPELVFKEADSSGRIHLAFVIAADEIDSVYAYVVDDTVLYATLQVDAQGDVFRTNDRYKDKLRLRVKRGQAGQVADPDLVAQAPSLNSNFIGVGIAYLYVRLIPTQGLLSESTKFEVICRMRKPVDPRTGTQGWTINPYVQLYDLLTKSRSIGGAGLDPSLIDTSAFNTAATWAEMTVETPQFTAKSIATTSSNNVFQFEPTRAVVPFQYGDVVQVSALPGGTLASALAPGVDYHVIPIKHVPNDLAGPEIKLAPSFADAMAGNAIVHGFVPDDFNITKVGEIRYHSGFAYRAGEEVVDDLLRSCGAQIISDNGMITLVRPVFPDPGDIEAVSLDELRGGIGLSNANRERTTELSGTYVSLVNRFKDNDYAKVSGGGLYETLDGQASARRFDLPFVGAEGPAQRLAIVELRQRRLEKSITFKGDISLYRLQPGTVFYLDAPGEGLDSDTTFRVTDQTLFVEIRDDRPSFGADITARQFEAEAVTVEASAQELVAAAAVVSFPSVRIVQPVGSVTITESLFQTVDGAGVRNRVTLAWTPSPDVFLAAYRHDSPLLVMHRGSKIATALLLALPEAE